LRTYIHNYKNQPQLPAFYQYEIACNERTDSAVKREFTLMWNECNTISFASTNTIITTSEVATEYVNEKWVDAQNRAAHTNARG